MDTQDDKQESIEDLLDDTQKLPHGKPVGIVKDEKPEYIPPKKGPFFKKYDPEKAKKDYT